MARSTSTKVTPGIPGRRSGADQKPAASNGEPFKELEGAANEIMALLDLFGHSLHAYRKLALLEGYQAWGGAGLGVLGDRATVRLKDAVEQLRPRPIRS